METIRINIEKVNNGFIVKEYCYATDEFTNIFVFENLKDALNFIEKQFKNK